MRHLAAIMILALLSACGDGESQACKEVDTSRAPDSVLVNGAVTTMTWGDCTKVYHTSK